MGMLGDPVQNIYQSAVGLDLSWRTMFYAASLTTTAASLYGTGTYTEAGSAANVAATATALAGRSYTTTTTLNNVASFVSDATHNISNNMQATWAIALENTTSRRFWAGFADVAPATMAASDTPTQNYFGFRYSTNVGGETTWKCVTDNASGSPTIVDSGITVGTGAILLSLIVQSVVPRVDFYINGQFSKSIAATLPSTAVNTLRPFASITNLSGGATRAFTSYFLNMRSKVV